MFCLNNAFWTHFVFQGCALIITFINYFKLFENRLLHFVRVKIAYFKVTTLACPLSGTSLSSFQRFSGHLLGILRNWNELSRFVKTLIAASEFRTCLSVHFRGSPSHPSTFGDVYVVRPLSGAFLSSVECFPSHLQVFLPLRTCIPETKRWISTELRHVKSSIFQGRSVFSFVHQVT